MRTVVIALIAGSLPLLSYAHPNVPKHANTLQYERTEIRDAPIVKVEKTAEVEKRDDREKLCASAEISAWNPAAAGWMCKATMWAASGTNTAG